MSIHRITFRDFIIRTWLELKSNFRYIFKIKKEGIFKITSDYKLVFLENFINDYKVKWDLGSTQWGGPWSSDYRQWNDDLQLKQSDDGIEISARIKPKYFPEIDKTINNAVDYLSSKETWKYGLFIFKSKLPSGTYLWPALWLTGKYNWPPEIDILEGYSEDSLDYNKNKTLQSNVHFGPVIDNDHENAGARTHRLPNKVTEEFIEYVLWWESDFIKIYYNGYLVRHITDKDILNGMSENMRIIINSAIMDGFNQDNITPLTVKEIKIYQKL